MLFWITIRSSILSLWANKLRSLLAMLGIIIGVGAVIAMVAMGTGAQKQVVDRIQAMGSNLLVVQPAQKIIAGVKQGNYQDLTVFDALALRGLPGVEAVTPSVNGSVQAKYMDKNTRTQITGGAITYFQIRNFDIEKGRPFTEDEAEGLARVAVLGPVTAADLFGDDDPIDAKKPKEIKINGINFQVIGILKSKGNQGWYNPDDQIIVPYTTAMKILFGLTTLREIDILASPGFDLTQLSGEPPTANPWHRDGIVHVQEPPADTVCGLLRRRHHLDGSEPDDFRIQNQADILETQSQFVWTFRILLFAIASISLLVGGIGIMNIMLVTVTERTREIGTRKAIGARNGDILMQFLVESVLMSGIGGSLGALSGVGLAKLIPAIPVFSKFETVIQLWVIILAVAVAGFVGIFFGLYPAYRASRLDPIEALRYE
jgi:putative ABC transport system permease protein